LPFGLISLLSWFAVPLITTIAAFPDRKNGYSFAGSFENKPTDTPDGYCTNTIEQKFKWSMNTK
jgi:putative membrane protein